MLGDEIALGGCVGDCARQDVDTAGRELARRLHGTGVTANCLHPGFVATGFGDNNRGIWRLGIAIGKLVAATSVKRGAETPVYVASSPELDGVTGRYYDKCCERAPDVPAQDDETAVRLWDESERLAGFELPRL